MYPRRLVYRLCIGASGAGRPREAPGECSSTSLSAPRRRCRRGQKNHAFWLHVCSKTRKNSNHKNSDTRNTLWIRKMSLELLGKTTRRERRAQLYHVHVKWIMAILFGNYISISRRRPIDVYLSDHFTSVLIHSLAKYRTVRPVPYCAVGGKGEYRSPRKYRGIVSYTVAYRRYIRIPIADTIPRK